MSALFTKTFWLEAADRSVKSAAQGVILGLGLGEGLNAFEVDWMLGLGFAAGGAVLSLLTSVANAGARRSPTAQSLRPRTATSPFDEGTGPREGRMPKVTGPDE